MVGRGILAQSALWRLWAFLFCIVLTVTSPLSTLSSWAYTPQYDASERENIDVYETAHKAVVTINALVNGGPSSGSGILIDPSGLILTSSHVIGEASMVSIAMEDGRRARGVVIGRMGDKTDLALIKINQNDALPYVKLGDSSMVKVGQRVLAIGNPYGFERTLTTGIISRIDRERNRLQTDAAINPGNSGGPLLDNQGYLIGINQSIYNPEGGRSNIGIGFAVPINAAKVFVKKLANQKTLPTKYTAYNDTPVVRYNPTSKVGYENVSDILKRFSQDEGF